MKIIVSFSGGKDSQACLIQAAKQYGADKIESVFCDTGWEHPLTYQHINDVCRQLDVKLTIIRNEKVGCFQNLCKRMKCFPVASRRVCTSALKIQPMIDWVISQDESFILIQGIRGKESASRAKMEPERFCREYGDGCPTVQEVIDYVNRDEAMADMFEPEGGYSCMSLYHGLCE